jgi:copper(I)-binding protein
LPFSPSAHSLLASAGPIEVRDAWAHATATAQPVGAGFATITNSGTADRLVGASCTCSQSVENARREHGRRRHADAQTRRHRRPGQGPR